LQDSLSTLYGQLTGLGDTWRDQHQYGGAGRFSRWFGAFSVSSF
jgi:hypothetical protein